VLPGRSRCRRLWTDHLVRNSLYLILSSGLQAALGFAFWIITARLFSTADVGRASSLISATTVIAYLALLGLNSTLVRHLPTAPDRNALITAGLLLVSGCGAGLGLLYVLLIPVLAPRLAFVSHRPALAAGFVLLTAIGPINLITDSVFVASRKAAYSALTDGGVGGVTKVVSVAVLSGSGAYGLFCASADGFVAAALVSVVMMCMALRWRPSFRKPWRALKPLLRFSGANYAGNVLNLLPALVVPLIVLDRLGASAAAYYFVAFQVATLLYATVYAVEQTFLAEGSHAGVDRREILRRSLRVLMALCLPACVVLVVAAHWVLLAFGTRYSQHAAGSLMLLASAAIPMAAINWLWTVLRLSGRLRGLVVSAAAYAIAICGLAWLLAPHGLSALTAAWPIGALLGAAVAALPHKAPPRHRRAARTRWSRGWPAFRRRTHPLEVQLTGGKCMNNVKAVEPAPRRVLIVSAYADPHVGGVEVVVGQQARTLAALGHDVTVVTSRCGADTAAREQADGYTVIRIPAWNGLEHRWGVPFPVWSPSAIWRLARLVGSADVVHVHDVYYGSSMLAASLARWRRRPLFVSQNVGIVEHDKAIVTFVQKAVYSSAGRLLWRWATTITAYNPIVENFLTGYGVPAEKIRLVYNGIDTRHFCPGDREAIRATRTRYGLAAEVPVILFVGRLVPKKGFQKLVEARSTEYEVVIAGPGRIPDQIPAGVRFLGPVNRDELRDLYQASDIFVFPAVGEMLTLVMQEAMACGLPVVATADEGYSRYDLDPSGVVLVEPEPEVLRSTFLGLLGAPGRMSYMRAYSRRLAEERFDWQSNAGHLVADYDVAREPGGVH
jgi:glycosyltransferase involved in cell wall biosynthesis/O-antigen/teichoic acid export membrane protein